MIVTFISFLYCSISGSSATQINVFVSRETNAVTIRHFTGRKERNYNIFCFMTCVVCRMDQNM